MLRIRNREKSRNSTIVEKEMEFEQEITTECYSFWHIKDKFKNYRFTEHIDEFRDEFNCQSKHHIKYYLMINDGVRSLFFGRFLTASLYIPDRFEIEFYSVDYYDNRGDPTETVDYLLQKCKYDEVKVGVSMESTFMLFASLTALSEYEQEQIEDLHDEGSDDEGYQETRFAAQPVETPFVTENCSICLTEKPDIILIPCLHKSVCCQCEERGKLTKCPTCRSLIIKKIKI